MKTLLVSTIEHETTETTWSVEVPNDFDLSDTDDLVRMIEAGQAEKIDAETGYSNIDGGLEVTDVQLDD